MLNWTRRPCCQKSPIGDALFGSRSAKLCDLF